MRNAIRCCISCILPCGALDVIRIVHVDGRVEEIGGTVSAAEIMKAYPKHVLKKPTSRFPDDVGADTATTTTTTPANSAAPRILVVPPDAELKRGKIYFLIPVPSTSSKKTASSAAAAAAAEARRRKKREALVPPSPAPEGGRNSESGASNTERYLSEVLREKVSTQRERRRGRVGVWRPRLESISESAAASAAADLAGDQ